MLIFELRLLGRILGSNFFAPFSSRQNSHQEFNPELGLKIHIALLQGHFAEKLSLSLVNQKNSRRLSLFL